MLHLFLLWLFLRIRLCFWREFLSIHEMLPMRAQHQVLLRRFSAFLFLFYLFFFSFFLFLLFPSLSLSFFHFLVAKKTTLAPPRNGLICKYLPRFRVPFRSIRRGQRRKRCVGDKRPREQRTRAWIKQQRRMPRTDRGSFEERKEGKPHQTELQRRGHQTKSSQKNATCTAKLPSETRASLEASTWRDRVYAVAR